MNKVVSIFRKLARLLSIILLLVLAGLQFVTLIRGLDGGSVMGTISSLTINLLLVLLYATPAILLLVKKDTEAKVTFSFLLGYLFITAVLNLLGYGELIRDGVDALYVIYGIIGFSLGLAYGFVLICFLLEKVFGLKLMKIGFLVLIISLALIFVLIILDIIVAIKADYTFTGYLAMFARNIIVPLVMIFGLMLLDESHE